MNALSVSAVGGKHATASVFVFACSASPNRWRLALIHHRRFGRWMVPGGHLEPGENPAEAARREVTEETGLAVTFVAPPGATAPAGLAGQLVAAPWWIVEEHIPAGLELDREPRAHVHIDFLYVAVAAPGCSPEHVQRTPAEGSAEGLAWPGTRDLPALDMFDGTRMAAGWLFTVIDTLTPATQPFEISTCAW